MRSAAVWDILRQVHVQFIRVGLQDGPLTPTEITVLTRIRESCMTPLVLLHLHISLSQAQFVVNTFNTYFGNSLVYYEFGNEPDVAFMSPQTYTSLWNQIVPQLKQVALNGEFGGPTVSYPFAGFIGYFMAHARPTPDFISWHKYYCSASMSTSACKADITNTLNRDVPAIQNAIRSTGHAIPPFIISEWNFAQGNIDRTTDFKETFVSYVFHEMVKHGIFASNQFEATDFDHPWMLVSNDAVTPESIAFKQTFEQFYPNAPTPFLLGITLSPTPLLSISQQPSTTPTPTYRPVPLRPAVLAKTPTKFLPSPTPVIVFTPTLIPTPTPTPSLTQAPTPLPTLLSDSQISPTPTLMSTPSSAVNLQIPTLIPSAISPTILADRPTPTTLPILPTTSQSLYLPSNNLFAVFLFSLLILVLIIVVIAVALVRTKLFHHIMHTVGDKTSKPLGKYFTHTPNAQTSEESSTIMEKIYYVKPQKDDGNGTWVLLTDDREEMLGYVANSWKKEGFVRIKGKLDNKDGKVFMYISEIIPIDAKT